MGRPRKPDPLTTAERSRLSRENAAGTVRLSVEAAADLEALQQPGEARTVALARVLREAATLALGKNRPHT